MMKILIVEDEIKTGEYLSKGLTEAGFVVDHADNGLTGYHLAMTAEYDLVILDIMLPDVNGWDIIRMLRSAGKGMPVLLLTALGTIEHRVKAVSYTHLLGNTTPHFGPGLHAGNIPQINRHAVLTCFQDDVIKIINALKITAGTDHILRFGHFNG